MIWDSYKVYSQISCGESNRHASWNRPGVGLIRPAHASRVDHGAKASWCVHTARPEETGKACAYP